MTQIPNDQIETVLAIAARLSVEREQAAAMSANDLVAAAAAAKIPADCVETAIAQVTASAHKSNRPSRQRTSQRHPVEGKTGARSMYSDQPTLITFINCTAEIRKLYWLDYVGERKFYQRLLPGQSYQLKTFLTHPWLVADVDDYGLAVYYPDADARMVELR
ncbi:MAG: hypothetical protein ACFBSG_07405 [Leptolyngbyaceae cyanobacterium]